MISIPRAEMGWAGLGNAKCNIVDLRMVFDARSARRFYDFLGARARL